MTDNWTAPRTKWEYYRSQIQMAEARISEICDEIRTMEMYACIWGALEEYPAHREYSISDGNQPLELDEYMRQNLNTADYKFWSLHKDLFNTTK